MAVSGMNHFTILTDDVPRTVDFYRDAVGLEPGPRPDLGFPGRVDVRGRTRRSCTSSADAREGAAQARRHRPHGVLRAAASPTRSRGSTGWASNTRIAAQAGTGIWQVFFFDPNGARVELDFAPSEAEPADGQRRVRSACRHDGCAARGDRPPRRRRADARARHRIHRRSDRRRRRDPAASTSAWARTTRSCGSASGCFSRSSRSIPTATKPARPRWFDLDDGNLMAELVERPRLIHWVARTRDIEFAASSAGYDPGPILPFARGEYRWRITMPDDGKRPGRRRPADADPVGRLAASGRRVAGLETFARRARSIASGRRSRAQSLRAARLDRRHSRDVRSRRARSPRCCARRAGMVAL